MKFWTVTAILLALIGCDDNVPEAAPGGSASANTSSYVDGVLQGRVSQHGLYRLVRSGGLVDNPNTSTGKTVSNAVIRLVKSTDRIPLLIGANMSLQFRLWYFPDQPAYVDLRRVLKHPAMTLPDGSVSTGSDYMMKERVSVNQVIAYTGYGFDEEYEMVEGDWIFEIWHEDRKLIEQKFTTYRPDKEEIAALASIFAPGTANQTTGEAFSNRDWPRTIVEDAGEKESMDESGHDAESD
jgi:hypothetical protein